VWTEELARAGSGGLAAGSAPTPRRHPADLEVRHRAAEAGLPGARRASDTATMTFQDVYVPEEPLLRELNRGFSLIMANFRWERLLMALGSVGGITRLLERAVARARLGPNRRGTDEIRKEILGKALGLSPTSRATASRCS
ncbi:MAG: acyl-CoA dehydrogenase family protein, partial [Solirubrobacteraceae bacterium]